MEGDKSVKNEMELGFIDSSKPMKELESDDDREGHGMEKQPTQRNSPTISPSRGQTIDVDPQIDKMSNNTESKD